jgi:hypothetical protein
VKPDPAARDRACQCPLPDDAFVPHNDPLRFEKMKRPRRET